VLQLAEPSRQLLALLDGSRDREGLLTRVGGDASQLDARLAELAGVALLMR
jgi:hypothetical protein